MTEKDDKLRIFRGNSNRRRKTVNRWSGPYKQAFFRSYTVNHNMDQQYEEFREKMISLPEVVHRHLVQVLPVSDRIAFEQSCSYFRYISRSTPWLVDTCDVSMSSTDIHIMMDGVCHKIRYDDAPIPKVLQAINNFMRNIVIRKSFRVAGVQPVYGLRNILKPFYSRIPNIEEIEICGMRVSQAEVFSVLKQLNCCRSYSFKNIIFKRPLDARELWPYLKRMERLILHRVSGLKYETNIFDLLLKRTPPVRPLKYVSMFLINTPISAHELMEFSRRYEQFDRSTLSELRVMFPSTWSKVRESNVGIGQIVDLVKGFNYDEGHRNRVLLSILMVSDDDFHRASNGLFFFGERPLL